jgi:aspartate/methionine/tyrosine aminotransferase
VDVRKLTTDSVDLCERLLREAHVAVVPGEAFHTPGFFRMSFALGEPELVEALTRMHLFFKKEASSTHHD